MCYLQQIGRVSDALAEARTVAQFDPLSPSAETWTLLYLLDRRDDAHDAFRRNAVIRVTPFSERQFELWSALESPDPAVMNARLVDSALAGKWGNPAAIAAALAPYTQHEVAAPRGTRATFAIFAAHHGEDALAIELLRTEFLPPGFGAYYLMWHPTLATVRAKPAFADFVTELGLVEAWRVSGHWGDYCRPIEATVTCR